MERVKYTNLVKSRLKEKRRFIEVLAGPRQVGKSTIIADVLPFLDAPYISESADDVSGSGAGWISSIWDRARMLEIQHGESVVIIDEIQKIPNWSEAIKKLWDEDSRQKKNIKVLLSGSSRLLLMKGLSESLEGRFELIPVPHWSYTEMHDVFGTSLDEFIFYGSYPGPAELVGDGKRWKSYIRDSIVEASLTRDIIMLTPIQKPALLRQLFELGSYYSAQILPFDHMLGQLSDAGNTTTLSSYLELLGQCGLLVGLKKYSGSEVRKRASSPKLQVCNNALMTCRYSKGFQEAKADPTLWGRLVESAIGTHLVNSIVGEDVSLGYWREGPDEVDFVLYDDTRIAAFEVKSGSRIHGRGTDLFRKRYPSCRFYTISYQNKEGSSMIPLDEFLSVSPLVYLQ